MSSVVVTKHRSQATSVRVRLANGLTAWIVAAGVADANTCDVEFWHTTTLAPVAPDDFADPDPPWKQPGPRRSGRGWASVPRQHIRDYISRIGLANTPSAEQTAKLDKAIPPS